MTKGGSLLVLGEELRRRLLLNLLPRPLLILQVQSDLALVHCPSINGNNPEGETDKQTNNTCASNKGKQTNKQTSRGGMCRGTDAGGGAELHSMQSPICNVSEYTEELQRCIGEGMEFDTQGCTLTPSTSHSAQKPVKVKVSAGYGEMSSGNSGSRSSSQVPEMSVVSEAHASAVSLSKGKVPI